MERDRMLPIDNGFACELGGKAEDIAVGWGAFADREDRTCFLGLVGPGAGAKPGWHMKNLDGVAAEEPVWGNSSQQDKFSPVFEEEAVAHQQPEFGQSPAIGHGTARSGKTFPVHVPAPRG